MDETSSQSESSQKIWIVLGIILVIVLFVVGVYYFAFSSSQQGNPVQNTQGNQNIINNSPQQQGTPTNENSNTKTFLYQGYSSSDGPASALEDAIASSS